MGSWGGGAPGLWGGRPGRRLGTGGAPSPTPPRALGWWGETEHRSLASAHERCGCLVECDKQLGVSSRAPRSLSERNDTSSKLLAFRASPRITSVCDTIPDIRPVLSKSATRCTSRTAALALARSGSASRDAFSACRWASKKPHSRRSTRLSLAEVSVRSAPSQPPRQAPVEASSWSQGTTSWIGLRERGVQKGGRFGGRWSWEAK